MVAALADLQVRVVARRELDACVPLRHEVDERVVRLGHVRMHRVHHLLRRVRAGDGQHLRMHLAHQVVAPALPGLAPRQPVTITLPFPASASPMASRLLLHPRRRRSAAGVDDDEIRAGAAIAAARPQTVEALAGISGIGARKLERYGAVLLELLRQ